MTNVIWTTPAHLKHLTLRFNFTRLEAHVLRITTGIAIERCCLGRGTGSPGRLSCHRMPDPVCRKSTYQYVMDIFLLRSNPTCSEAERSSHELLISTANDAGVFPRVFVLLHVRTCRLLLRNVEIVSAFHNRTKARRFPNLCPFDLFAFLKRDSPVTIVLVPLANTPFSDETTRCGSKVLKTWRSPPESNKNDPRSVDFAWTNAFKEEDFPPQEQTWNKVPLDRKCGFLTFPPTKL
ncbi:hypothetical protein Hypma_003540 [Hypsizygus marmoreus]|uniref:Uncharacterized protein n=1 Tax=Hypsizygus marmoreus TaxID=39966 RepID=A0A369J8V9_HYPMA|nr:hypothetical protein Hypma_003540 [Hypsizygus marmoreus]